eukprot:1322737-Rhodomonas_salina.1
MSASVESLGQERGWRMCVGVQTQACVGTSVQLEERAHAAMDGTLPLQPVPQPRWDRRGER